jgi:single-stranded DNA-binding protein
MASPGFATVAAMTGGDFTVTIDCAFYGFLAADADARTSKAGKPWVRLRVGVGKDDAVQWVSISVFGKAADTAATLKKGDRVYCEGNIKLDTWRGNDGLERHALAVAAFKCEQTHKIGRAKDRRTSDHLSDDQHDSNDDMMFGAG